MDNNCEFKKCSKCFGYKCKYYDSKTPLLSKDICYLCFGRKELCIQPKPDVYKIIKCNNCSDNNYFNFYQMCNLCDFKHYICICKINNTKYPYYVPY